MKMSINSEKLIVAATLAIVVTLLASACGRNNMKTLQEKQRTFADDVISDNDKNLSEKDKNNLAIEQKRAVDLAQGTEVQSDIKATEELAKRIAYIVYEEKMDKNAKIATLRVEMIANNKKRYVVDFAETAIDGKMAITFASNTAKEKDDSTAAAIELPLQAQLNISKHGRSIVTLTEKTVDTKKSTTTATVNALIITSKANAQVDSKEASLLKMKDATIQVRMTQLYTYYENFSEASTDSKILKLASNANRVAIDVKDKNNNEEIYSLVSKFSSQKHLLHISRVIESLSSTFNKETLTMEITSIDTAVTIESTVLGIAVSDMKSNKIGQVILNLYNGESLEDTIRNRIEDKKTEEVDQANEDTQPTAESDTAANPAATEQDSVVAAPADVPLIMPEAKKEEKEENEVRPVIEMSPMIIHMNPNVTSAPVQAGASKNKAVAAKSSATAVKSPATARTIAPKAAGSKSSSNKSKNNFELGIRLKNGVIITAPSPK